MARKAKTLLIVAVVVTFVYFMSFAGISVAEHAEISGGEQFDGVTISVEACVVRVAIEALDEIAGGSNVLNMGSIPAAKVLERVGGEGAELVSSVKLAMGNGSVAEMTTEENSRQKGKDHADETGEYADREILVSFQAEAQVMTAEKIAVKFSFKQIVAENASSESGDGEQEEEVAETCEVSSRLALETGQPRVAGAKKNEDVATFLILRADI